jgi:Cu-Zn family superoxide dismutase
MIAVTSLAGCALDFGGAREPQGGPTAPLVNAAGQSIGTIRLWESPGAVTFRIEGRGLPHGTHGLHVHTTGRCDPPAFETAGPHWNPAQRRHGFNNPAGPHGGDMPNVRVAANGVIGATVTLAGGSHMALLDADGSALVIHAAPDDYTTDPSGNSGARIACAVIPQPLPPR